jgi:SPP1 family predicted phage head-tail adaptor
MRLGNKITNPGELRTRVALKHRTTNIDPGGFQKEALSTVRTVWAKWVGVHGMEAWAANSANALRAATVTTRYYTDVDETWVVSEGVEDYQIVSIDDLQHRHEYLELKVELIRSA